MAARNLNVCQEALDQGVLGNAQQSHVDTGDDVTNDEDANERRNRAVKLVLEVRPVLHNEEADASVGDADENLAQEDEPGRNALGDEESARVFED